MSITPEEKARVMKEFGTKEGDRALQDTQKRQPWPPWPFENGRNAPQAAGLRQVQG